MLRASYLTCHQQSCRAQSRMALRLEQMHRHCLLVLAAIHGETIQVEMPIFGIRRTRHTSFQNYLLKMTCVPVYLCPKGCRHRHHPLHPSLRPSMLPSFTNSLQIQVPHIVFYESSAYVHTQTAACLPSRVNARLTVLTSSPR